MDWDGFYYPGNLKSAVFTNDLFTSIGELHVDDREADITINFTNQSLTFNNESFRNNKMNNFIINLPYATFSDNNYIFQNYRSTNTTLNAPNMLNLGSYFIYSINLSDENITQTFNLPYVQTIGNNFIHDYYNDNIIINAPNLISIENNNFENGSDYKYITLNTPRVVSIGTNNNFDSIVCVQVPDNLVEAYKIAPNWSEIADKIIGMSENPPLPILKDIIMNTNVNTTDFNLGGGTQYITAIDWGDGTSEISSNHTYSIPGQYTIRLRLNRSNSYVYSLLSGCEANEVTLQSNMSYMYNFLSNSQTSIVNINSRNAGYFYDMLSGSQIPSIIINAPYYNGFYGLLSESSTTELTLNAPNITYLSSAFERSNANSVIINSQYITDINQIGYDSDISIITLNTPNSTNIPEYVFYYGRAQSITLNAPYVTNSYGYSYNFLSSINATNITLNMPNLQNVGRYFLKYNYGEPYDLTINSLQVPGVEYNYDFSKINQLIVPQNLLEEYKTTAPWSTIADKIISI
jgi:hypothetical protein